MLLFILFVIGVFVVGVVLFEILSIVVVLLGCVDGGVDGGIVGFEVYLVVIVCEDSVIFDGEIIFDFLMFFVVGEKIMIIF